MRVVSFNANGLRSVASKGFFDWFAGQHVDLLCVQETKAQEAQLGAEVFRPSGYRTYFHDAVTRKGYSGVAIYSKREPDEVLRTLGVAEFDAEGRYLEARFGRLSVVSLYFPSGSSSELRRGFKFRCMDWFASILHGWLHSDRDYIVCGDWNIVRSRQDIHNWSSNQKTSGCLPEERAWMNALFTPRSPNERAWVDSYRHLRPEGEEYTWWSSRGAARQKDVGWRIDYQVVSPGLRDRLLDCGIHKEPRFSDHAPYYVDYDA